MRPTPQHGTTDVQAAAGEPAYRSAHVNRFNKSWQPEQRSGNDAVYDSYERTTARTRDMVRNDPVFRKAKSKLEELVVGTGLQSFADAVDDKFEALDDFNDEADFLWQHWAEKEADVEGKLSWWDMERILFGEMPEQGNALLLRCIDNRPGRMIPLCFQMIEFEQLDKTKDRPAGFGVNKIQNGIEFDSANRVLGYHLLGAHPFDSFSDPSKAWRSEFVPAERVVHSYIPMRPSMAVGISWFTAILQPTRDMDWYLGNELTAAAIASLLTVIIKEKNRGSAGLGLDDGEELTDPRGNEQVKLGRGVIARIGSEDEVKVVESSRPSRGADPFIKLLLMFQSMGVNLSYHRLTGDTQRSSYTAIRASHLDDAAMVRPLQQFYGRKVSLRVRTEHMLQMAGMGRYKRMTASYLKANMAYVNRFEVIGPGREQLDPEKETTAALDRVDGCLSTLKIECGLRGLHYRAVMRQRAKELRLQEDLQIPPRIPTAKPVDQKPLDDDELLDDEPLDDEEEELE